MEPQEPMEQTWTKRKWRSKEVRDAEKRDHAIRRERREAKRAEKDERRKRREVKAMLRAELAASPTKPVDTYQANLRCKDCGGGMIVAMPRDPETGNNLPICERCAPVSMPELKGEPNADKEERPGIYADQGQRSLFSCAE
jgi:hypothetical protein